MTDRHWQVVRYMRQQYLDTGTAPSIRALGKASGVPVKELYQLFPKGPAKLAAKIAGHPQAARLHLSPERTPTTGANHGCRTDREGVDHRVEGVVRRDLPRR